MKDENTSAGQFSTALGRLQELYGIKDSKGTATPEEKETFQLLNDMLTGKISPADTEKLGTMLGISQEKLAEAQKGFASRYDDAEIR